MSDDSIFACLLYFMFGQLNGSGGTTLKNQGLIRLSSLLYSDIFTLPPRGDKAPPPLGDNTPPSHFLGYSIFLNVFQYQFVLRACLHLPNMFLYPQFQILRNIPAFFTEVIKDYSPQLGRRVHSGGSRGEL